MRLLACLLVLASVSCHRTPARPTCLSIPPGRAEPAALVLDRRHRGGVDAVSFSPDGTRIASLSFADKTLHVWSAERGSLAHIHAVPIDANPFRSGALSHQRISDRTTAVWADERSVIAGVGDVSRLDAQTGSLFPFTSKQLQHVRAFDHGRFVGADIFGRVVIVDVVGSPQATLTARRNDRGTMTAVVFVSPSGDAIVRADEAGYVRWTAKDLASGITVGVPWPIRGELLELLPGGDGIVLEQSGLGLVSGGALPGPSFYVPHEDCEVSVTAAPDGRHAAIATCHGAAVWDLRERNVLWEVRGNYSQLAFGRGQLAAARASGDIDLFDVASGRLRHTLGAPMSDVARVGFVDDDRLAIAAQDDKTSASTSIVSLRMGRRIGHWTIADADSLLLDTSTGHVHVAWRAVASSSSDDCGEYKRWIVASYRNASADILKRTCVPGERGGIALAGPRLVFGAFSHVPGVLDIRSGDVIAGPLTGSTYPSESGEELVTIGLGARIWNAADGKDLHGLILTREEGVRTAAVRRDMIAVGHDRGFDLHAPGGGDPALVQLPFAVETLWMRGTRVLAGGLDGSLALVDRGRVVATARSDGGAIREIAVSPSGSRAATISTDGAVRIWDAVSVKLLATYVTYADGEWLMFAPNGQFTGSREASVRVSWRYADDEPFPFETFANTFEAPAAVREALAGKPPAAASPVRPPRVVLVSSNANPGGKTLHVEATATSTAGLASVRVFGDGRVLAEQRMCGTSGQARFDVELVDGPNLISVVAFDTHGAASNPAQTTVQARIADEDRRPDLWILALGVGSYPDLAARWQLSGPERDARLIADAFGKLAGAAKPYRAAHSVVITNADVTSERVTAAMRGFHAMRPQDVAIVFLAGHGWRPSEEADMVFLTSAARPDDPGHGAIRWSLVERSLDGVRGRVIMFVDACHSGQITQDRVVPNDRLAALLASSRRPNIQVFAASKGRQFAYEGSVTRGFQVRHRVRPPEIGGLFTTAVVRALRDAKTDRNLDGVIGMSELVARVSSDVSRVSGGKQTPWLLRRDLFGEMRLAPAPRTGLAEELPAAKQDDAELERPRIVPPPLFESLRTAGTRQIVPDDDARRQIVATGQQGITATLKVCIDEEGAISTVELVRSTGVLAYDQILVDTIHGSWTFRPYVVDDQPTAACTAATFIYSWQ